LPLAGILSAPFPAVFRSSDFPDTSTVYAFCPAAQPVPGTSRSRTRMEGNGDNPPTLTLYKRYEPPYMRGAKVHSEPSELREPPNVV